MGLIEMKSKILMSKNFWVAVGIILISTVPYLHDVIEFDEGGFLGFSTKRVFLFMLLINVYAHLGWLFAFFLAKNKPYRFALLVPVSLSFYQIVILLTGLKDTPLNEVTTKFVIIIIAVLILIIKYFNSKANV